MNPSAAAGDTGKAAMRLDSAGTTTTTTMTTNNTASMSYTEEEMEQVRQVLAENGYPDPSAEDIAQVLRHVQLYLHAGSSTPASEADMGEESRREVEEENGEIAGKAPHAEENEGVGQRVASHDTVSEPALHSVRRFAPRTGSSSQQQQRHYQRNSQGSSRHRRPVLQAAWDDSTQIVHSRVQGPHFPASRSPPRRSTLLSSEHTRTSRHSVPYHSRDLLFAVPPTMRLERHVRRHARSLATELYAQEAQHQPLQQQQGEEEGEELGGIGSLDEQATPAPANVLTDRRSANVIFNMTGDRRYRFRPTTAASPAEGTILPTTSYKNLYNAQSTSRRRGQALSTYSVSYLAADGSTLRTKADPVTRGAQMRLLWSRDRFLTQRNRPAEVWRTRQVMMSVDSSV